MKCRATSTCHVLTKHGRYQGVYILLWMEFSYVRVLSRVWYSILSFHVYFWLLYHLLFEWSGNLGVRWVSSQVCCKPVGDRMCNVTSVCFCFSSHFGRDRIYLYIPKPWLDCHFVFVHTCFTQAPWVPSLPLVSCVKYCIHELMSSVFYEAFQLPVNAARNRDLLLHVMLYASPAVQFNTQFSQTLHVMVRGSRMWFLHC